MNNSNAIFIVVVDDLWFFLTIFRIWQKEIEKLQKLDGLKKVLVEITKFVFDSYLPKEKSKTKSAPHIPIYDHIYKTVSDEIKRTGVVEPALVSWLTDEQKDKAKRDSVADISSIDDPFEVDVHHYPEPDFDYFHRLCPTTE